MKQPPPLPPWDGGPDPESHDRDTGRDIQDTNYDDRRHMHVPYDHKDWE